MRQKLSKHAILYFATLSVMFSLIETNGSDVTGYFYKKEPVCGASELLDNMCISLSVASTMSRLQCAILCYEHHSSVCQDFVVSDTGSCFLRHSCLVDESSLSCSLQDYSYSKYRRVDSAALNTRPCFNNGVFNSSSLSCECQNNWVGAYCERSPVSCQELRHYDYPLGYHIVDMHVGGDLRTPTTTIKCQLGETFTNTYISTSTGKSDFNATNEQYKNGFYNGPDAFWIGLDNIHHLNTGGLNRLVLNVYAGGTEVNNIYDDVVIGDEGHGYGVTFSSVMLHGSSGHVLADECLIPTVKFSTWDSDNDQENERNIASEAGAGWWYKDLSFYCNPNGLAPTNISDGSANQLQYVTVPGIDLSHDALGQDFERVIFYFAQSFP